jgi:SpoIID/LytB domain protein
MDAMRMPKPLGRLHRRLWHLFATAAATAGLVLSGAFLAVPSASADSAIRPTSGSFTVRGAGFGHGWGMSQYGAYGAAVRGLTWQQILAFYYPGTVQTTLSQRTIRVWITADKDGDLRVRPASGLKITSGSKSYQLPTGSTYQSWRISRSGSGYKLQYQTSSGAWKTRNTGLGTGTWKASTSSGIVTVIMPGGSRREYRGTVSLVKRGSSGRTVNTVSMENYVRSVVPSEMPTSWALEAVKAQTVAARTYAAKLRSRATSSGYDICDTTACQVYSGYARTIGGKRTVRETSRGNEATKATANVILSYRGSIALTQFASSNGGAAARGDYPYLAAHPDGFDGVIKSQAWTKNITAAAVARKWSVGTVQKIQITARDGSGSWGGRVRSMKIIGSKRTVTITGGAFRSAFGLRSTLFTLGGSSGPISPSVPTPPVPIPPPAPEPPPPAPEPPPPAPEPPPPAPEPAPTSTPPTTGPYAAFPRTYDVGGWPELLIISADGTMRRHPVSATGLGVARPVGSGFGFLNVVNAGDWNGDGRQDVIARTVDNHLWLFRATPSGMAAGVSLGDTSPYRSLTGVGDLNGDTHPDLVALTSASELWLLPGNGATGRGRSVKLASGWKDQDLVRGISDLTGDKFPDLVARAGDRLYLYAGTRNGIKSGKLLGTGWAKYASISSVGDLNGDERADVVGRTMSGALVLHLGTSAGTLAPGRTIATGFDSTRFAT